MDTLTHDNFCRFLTVQESLSNIHIFETIESTNTTAKDMARKGAAHGTIVMAGKQTAGRGRQGRSFFSPPDNGLYISFILHGREDGLLTHLAAVKVCETIEFLTGRSPSIKWVNDIFLRERKVCGILTEGVVNKSGTWCAVVGIGVNLIVPAGGFPKELENIAGAVYRSGSEPQIRNRFAAELADRMLGHDYDTPKQEILKEYRRRLMMLLEPIKIIQSDGEFYGTALDINDAGELVVEKDNKEIVSLKTGDISIRRQ